MNAWSAALLLWSLSAAAMAPPHYEEQVCGSLEMRNSASRLRSLQNCTVVDGHVQIVLLDATKADDFGTFPALREITQYLLVYRVSGLLSLGKLFPNLMLIRGSYHNSEFPGQTLMVHDNADLKEIGLYNLTNITQGSVIITKNPNLCHATTIDWGQITNGVSNDDNIISGNDVQDHCTGCSETGCAEGKCWSHKPQVHCQHGKLKDCHPLCAGGCYQPHSSKHCYVCAAYVHNGDCIRDCPPGLYGHIRTCLTEEQCRRYMLVDTEESTNSKTYIPLKGLCLAECPYGFEYYSDQFNKSNCRPCMRTAAGSCLRDCKAFRITEDMILGKSQTYRSYINCTTVDSLDIEIKYGTSEVVERRLEEIVGKVEVILAQLKITRSYSLNSLNFLRNLREIRGQTTGNNVSLVVHGNKNLKELWSWDQRFYKKNLTILNGSVSFHYNPKLCYNVIREFGDTVKLPAFTDIEVSSASNGDQYACYVTELKVDTVKINSQSIILRMHRVQDTDQLERFLVYFIEASKWNEREETNECEDNSWKIDDISSKRSYNETYIDHVITSLEPNTEYYYYVKTYTIASKTSKSSLFRNKTLPSKPSAPQNFTALTISSSQVELSWKPPSHPHGKLVKYTIKGFLLKDDRAILDQRDYCVNKTKGENDNKDSLYRPQTVNNKPPDVFEQPACQCESQKPVANYNNNNDVCSMFEHGLTTDINVLNGRKNLFETCSNFLNVFIDAKCFALQYMDETEFPNDANKNCKEEWSISNALRNETQKDNSLVHFAYDLDENVTSYQLDGLSHYSQYILSIMVCREIVDQERGETDESDSCSHETLLSFRTEKNIKADVIDDSSVQHAVSNRTVTISWREPQLVNSIVHSFLLEYTRINPADEQSATMTCITMKEFERGGKSYALRNLSPGDYQFKIRAQSLAGQGPATGYKQFVIEDESIFSMYVVLIVVIFLTLALAFVTFLLRTYFNQKLLQRNSLYNLANNPGYVGIYVEDEWELVRENVQIVKVLGRGTFGTVHEGILLPQNEPCAVKSVSKTNFLKYHAEFLNEASIMKKFSEAYHIVKLLGVVTKSYPPLLVMELMGRGDLKSVLVSSRDNGDPPPPSRYTTIRMAAQIADGMAFLEYNKFIHRDLAARNCMVATDLTVKIGDFGMSRQIFAGNYYRKGNKGEMPIRWMAPESMAEGLFTSQSDVWSYGVVLWEMLTLGEQPYKGKSNNDVMAYVLDGNMLDLPIFCPDVLAGIMKSCWSWTSVQRPRFLQIIETLDAFLDKDFKKVSFYHNRSADSSIAEYSIMSPTTTCEDNVDADSVHLDQGETGGVYSRFQVDQNNISNGHLSSI
ncbi:insulin-like peptide receptor [Adelges cooleyi]|uniref:insulin-like peptide receptor n=1 Tax=Adelges cooleyi TaxID=133065 RepID=UPI00217F6D94|nr:insulin-like peptide receptor [Adelges cooleyi]XP_050431862.1 insulin-like peptide receptor [Adelges cooleyi]XP_050431863.1 insulin-like peptide receptor [Adelges cooleyi]